MNLSKFHLSTCQYLLIHTKNQYDKQSEELTNATTMTRSCSRHGAQAKCFLTSKLCTHLLFHAHITNLQSQKHLKKLVAIRIADFMHGGCFTTPTIQNKELFSQKLCAVIEEGPQDFIFEDEATPPQIKKRPRILVLVFSILGTRVMTSNLYAIKDS